MVNPHPPQPMIACCDLCRFFEAHRVIAAYGPELGQGFWTRFTVRASPPRAYGVMSG